jgi:hypothetical protein
MSKPTGDLVVSYETAVTVSDGTADVVDVVYLNIVT